MHDAGPEDPEALPAGPEGQLMKSMDDMDPKVLEEYRFSALELLGNVLLPPEALDYLSGHGLIFVPKRMET